MGSLFLCDFAVCRGEASYTAGIIGRVPALLESADLVKFRINLKISRKESWRAPSGGWFLSAPRSVPPGSGRFRLASFLLEVPAITRLKPLTGEVALGH